MQNYNALWKILRSEDLILTPNKRLLVFLLQQYNAHQQQLKRKIWSTPRLFTLVDWIHALWEKQLLVRNILPPLLLTPYEEQVLWQRIIDNSEHFLLRTDSVAHTAKQAWQLTQFWQIDYRSVDFEYSEETQTWKKWAEQFTSYCRQYNVTDYATAIHSVIQRLSKNQFSVPQRIFIIGFDDLNPLIQKLFHTLREKGSVIEICNFCNEEKPEAYRIPFLDKETELQTMARWTHQQWKKGEQSIFCVVPQLLENRTLVVDHFYDVFMSLEGRVLDPWPFNIAAGKSLIDYPLIQTFFNLLQLKKINSLKKISSLIRSPYLPYSEEECFARTQLDLYCRRYLEETISLTQLISLCEQQGCPHLAKQFTQLQTFIENNTSLQKRLPSAWCDYFINKLQCIGMSTFIDTEPNLLPLVTRWSEQLQVLQRLDQILGKISREAAFNYLYQSNSAHLFQEKTHPDTPIHVLGLLDTAGLCVKNLWLMRFDEQTWPAPARPNPFIPLILQRTRQLPHASNERELYFASQLTQRLLQSASQIWVSYATQVNQQSLRPSRLITHLPEVQASFLQLLPYQSLSEKIWQQRVLETYIHEYAPPLSESEPHRGGASLLKKQAACPFQAFAYFRLNAKFYPIPQAGLNPIERGQLLHEALEIFWNRLQNQTNLQQMNAVSLEESLQFALETVIKRWRIKKPFTWKAHFSQLEKIRLRQRLDTLIEWEKKRPVFYAVRHEQKQTFSIGQLILDLRMDRIDQLADGSLLIIDYKTGTLPSTRTWLETRLDEPQMPLYCLSQPKARGFAVIQLTSQGLNIKGLSEKENGVSSALSESKKYHTPENWTQLCIEWRATLEKLAQEYQMGWAAVQPKHGSTTCRHCDLHRLCRIHHLEESLEHHD
ncbi:PD-(D/E)XK nuclease family protein [Rickettsiella massiliensis]|uniref:PD-(D/E)XK nuclease family protein n=1 Tax=Rickettsiella massiliensis TaxID=676517 RepID=UPI00029AF6E0|nr:PD-(D/E)XK nuclease family protein [Rickettsiella massiliensis]